MRFRRSRMGIRPAPVSLRTLLLMYLCCFFFAGGAILFYIEETLRPTYQQLAETVSRRVATEAITSALLNDIAHDTSADNLIKVIVDKDGRATAAQLNPLEVARMQNLVAAHVQHALNSVPQQQLTLQVGQAFHNTLLANLGPNVELKLLPLGNVISSVDTQSQQSGINQTLNIINLNITAQVRVIAPFVTRVIEVSTRVPMAYVVLVGQVPMYFFNSSGHEFVPQGTMPPGIPGSTPNLPLEGAVRTR